MPKTPQNEVEILRKKLSFLEVELSLKNEVIQKSEQALKEVTARLKKQESDYDLLVQRHMELQRNRFGRKCERFVDDENPQTLLFPVEFDGCDPNPDPDDIEVVTFTRKKGGGRRSLDMSGLPQRVETLHVEGKDRTCSCCGSDKTHAGFQCSSRLHVIPARFEVVIERREKLSCPKGCESQFVTAPLPLRVLPKSIASESLAAHIIVSKVLDRQPLYHLEKAMEQRFGFKIGRNLMAKWMITIADQLQPLINLMKDQIDGYDVAAIDATSFHVLNEPGRKSQTKSYAYCIRGGPPDKRVILYEYNAYVHKDYVDDTLANFMGVLHCDASTVFNKIGSKDAVRLSYCHAHARRKFEQIEKAAKKGKAQLATEAMQMYRSLYAIERYATDANMSPEDRLALRQEKSRPILDRFHQWLRINRDKTLPKSPIGLAIAYCLTHWDGLLTYLTDGRVEIDNNSTERDIKPFVIARKNFLFACTPQGADSLGIHFSLVLTARLHGLDPMAYYTVMLKRLPSCMSIEDYEALLPWNWNP